MNIKSNVKSGLVSLMYALLIVSLFACVFSSVEAQSAVHVDDETALRNAVNNARDGASTVIVLDKNIALKEILYVPAEKVITLKSNGNAEYFKLFGGYDQIVINIMSGGSLTLDGIVVTHMSGVDGGGIFVDVRAKLTLQRGEISGNSRGGITNYGEFTMTGGTISGNSFENGGGVYNWGDFVMAGGKISGNTAGSGGGVYNKGAFSLSSGEISNNTVSHAGGGVYNERKYDLGFTMSGGVISGNTGSQYGGGVYNGGLFTLSGGKISGNMATNMDWRYGGGFGGGVYTDYAIFDFLGGVISGNTAYDGGGVYSKTGDLTMSGSEISGNTAIYSGGGVFINEGTFKMSGNVISDNKAENGGGVYANSGVVELTGGRISGNTATENGGGIWISEGNLGRLFIKDTAFSQNSASVAYNRDPIHDDMYNAYISGKVTWTAPYTQGYNNYDVSYTSGSKIAGSNNAQSGGKDTQTSTNDRQTGTDGEQSFWVSFFKDHSYRDTLNVFGAVIEIYTFVVTFIWHSLGWV